jgi:two-component sensor histidine kinase
MRASSATTDEPETQPARARGAASLKSRLAGVLLLASLPGVVLGGLEARRAYVSAAQAEREDVTRMARQTANRVEEVVSGALILVESLSQAPMVRIGSASCNAVLASAATQSSRFEAISRLDRGGRVLCSSDAGAVGASLRGAPWFDEAISRNRPIIAPAWIGGRAREQIIPLSAPILDRDRTTGIVVLGLRAVWLITQAAEDLAGENASIVVFDGAGAPFAVSAHGLSQTDAIAAAQRAIAGAASPFGSVQAGVAAIAGGGLKVVVVAPTESTAIGFRAALITAAPLIAVALAMAAVWIALNWWVMRWIDSLVKSARSASEGAYEPADLANAPSELRVLGAAFDDAVGELARQLAKNLALTRELHHRVKNNLQVVTSALARQFRRTQEPTARYALAEARARLLPIALAFRYGAEPEEITRVDLGVYLTELARQIHATLDGAARGVDLRIECMPLIVSNDAATAVGMAVAECLTSAYLSSTGMSSAAMSVRLARNEEGAVLIDSGVERVNPSHDAAKLDEPLIRQLAHQIGAEVTIELGPRIRLLWRQSAGRQQAALNAT